MLSQVFEKVYDEETGAFFYYNKHVRQGLRRERLSVIVDDVCTLFSDW